jgi:Galactose oxidase, central domain/Kelch motif
MWGGTMQIHSHRLFAFALASLIILSSCHAAERPPTAARGRIVPAASMQDARADHTATLLRDGRVLITGGMVENGVFLDTAELFDPKSGKFEPLPKMHERRVGHTASLLPDGRVVIAGGSSGREMVDGNWVSVPAMSIEIYDPAQKKFTTAGQMRGPRTSQAGVALPDGRVAFLGGYARGAIVDSVEIFDPRTGRSDDGGKLASPREGCGCVLLKDGKILLSGGSRAERELNGTFEIYDPAAKTSRTVAQMQTPRRKHAAVVLDDGRVLIIGGSNTRDWTGQYASAEVFDPKTGKSTAAANMAKERFKINHAAVVLEDGTVLVAGGKGEAEVFEPSANKFVPVEGSMDGPHYFSTATLLGDGRVLIAGGYGNGGSGNGPLSTKEAWLYDPKH